MPAKTEKQRRFFGAELARKRAGKKTQTGLPEEELRKMAHKSPPSGVDGYTVTTDLPKKANHGTSPVPSDKVPDEGSAGGQPSDVRMYSPFQPYSYKGEKKVPGTVDKTVVGGTAKGMPADVDKDFKRMP
jgi:hypothetical protein